MDTVDTVAPGTPLGLRLQLRGIQRMQAALLAVDPAAPEDGSLQTCWRHLEADRRRLVTLLADAAEPVRGG